MHFNPGDDDHEIIAPLITDVNENENSNLGLPRTTYAGWTEPALRSDRMCWSLIGCAYTLSYELGIFDSLVDHGTWIPHSQHKRSYDTDRADRLGRLLHIYVSQTCGRLGFPNIWPENRKGVSIDFFKMKVLSSGSCKSCPYMIYINLIQWKLAHPMLEKSLIISNGHGQSLLA